MQQKTLGATSAGSDSLSASEVHVQSEYFKNHCNVFCSTPSIIKLLYCLFQVQLSQQSNLQIPPELPTNFMQVELSITFSVMGNLHVKL